MRYLQTVRRNPKTQPIPTSKDTHNQLACQKQLVYVIPTYPDDCVGRKSGWDRGGMYCRLLSFTYLWVRQFEILISPKHFCHLLLCLSFAIPGYQLLPVFLSDVKAQLSDIYKFISVDVDRVQGYAIRPGSVRNRHADTVSLLTCLRSGPFYHVVSLELKHCHPLTLTSVYHG